MKAITAFVHKHRIAAVIEVLQAANVSSSGKIGGLHNISVVAVQSLLQPVDLREQRYGVDLAQPVIQDYKLELLCADDEAERLVQAIAAAGRTGQEEAGWVFVTNVESALRIGRAES